LSWQEILKDYFNFSKKDRLAFLLLAGLVLCLALLPRFFPKPSARDLTPADTTWLTAMKQLQLKEERRKGQLADSRQNNPEEDYVFHRPKKFREKNKPFVFDPNTIDENGWRQLGLRDKTIVTIQNYLAKGGRFYKPGDLARIYGLFPDEYERLEPYIRIEKKAEDEHPLVKQNRVFVRRSNSIPELEINEADTSAFINLPGIGSKLANRIVNFRDKLGGFYAIEQISETFGLPDSTFRKIKPLLKLSSSDTKKININTATIDELKTHPYIRFNVARILVAYREQHGLFEKPEDIKKIMAITEEQFNKLLPYLTTGGE
jgi:competence protein ComEA